MVHGRIVRPPARAATLRGLDDDPVRKLPGVVEIVHDGRFLGVDREREYQAVVARARAGAGSAVGRSSASLPAPATLYRTLRSARAQDFVILERGSSESGTGAQTRQRATSGHTRCTARSGRRARWRASPTAATSSGPTARASTRCATRSPSCCARAEARSAASTSKARAATATTAPTMSPRCGAARARDSRSAGARAVDARRRARVGAVRAADGRSTCARALDPAGAIVAWQHEVWSNTHSTRPGQRRRPARGRRSAAPFAATPPKPIPPARRRRRPQRDSALRVAERARRPPLPAGHAAARLGAALARCLHERVRDRELHRRARARREARSARVSPAQPRRPARRARSFGRLASGSAGRHGRRSATGADAGSPSRATRISAPTRPSRWRSKCSAKPARAHRRAVAATDSGEAVNPDGIGNQIEGGIVQSRAGRSPSR